MSASDNHTFNTDLPKLSGRTDQQDPTFTWDTPSARADRAIWVQRLTSAIQQLRRA